MADPLIEKTPCVEMADLLEQALIEKLKNDPSAADMQAARQYLKDQGFVALKRPNANITPMADLLHDLEEGGEQKGKPGRRAPFPVDADGAG